MEIEQHLVPSYGVGTAKIITINCNNDGSKILRLLIMRQDFEIHV